DQSESVVLLRTSKATDRGVTAHEVFHVLQNSVWVRAGKFLQEATAVWAQQRAFPGEGFSTDLDPTAPLDCFDDDVCANAGYQSWSFFEFLAERDGPHIVREIFDQAKALQINRNGSTLDPVAALAAISAALAPHHRMLGPTFRDFALANINGDYSLGELRDAGLGYLTDTKPLRTGASTGTLARRVVTINHLATNYLPVAAGGGKKHGRCRKATLRLDIAGPKSDAYAGYALGDRKSKTIAIANGRGHLTLHSWSTCGGPELILALVNSATSRDDLTFITTATLTVP
ncbi:MAG: hypothetical protein QOH95_1300, partial [Gaiellaceae bacterium]|nr:hypothetical protein [Gaiellaceae bacterium]